MSESKPRAQNGKGDANRIGDRKSFDNNYDQIQWASKRRRGGRAGSVMKDKTKYDRKKGWGEE